MTIVIQISRWFQVHVYIYIFMAQNLRMIWFQDHYHKQLFIQIPQILHRVLKFLKSSTRTLKNSQRDPCSISRASLWSKFHAEFFKHIPVAWSFQTTKLPIWNMARVPRTYIHKRFANHMFALVQIWETIMSEKIPLSQSLNTCEKQIKLNLVRRPRERMTAFAGVCICFIFGGVVDPVLWIFP